MKRINKFFITIIVISIGFLIFNNKVMAFTDDEENIAVPNDIACIAVRAREHATDSGPIFPMVLAIKRDGSLTEYMGYWDYADKIIINIDAICPDIILYNGQRNNSFYFKKSANENTDMAIGDFYEKVTKALNGKHNVFWFIDGRNYYDDQLFVNYDRKLFQNITKQIETNYNDVKNAISEFKSHFNIDANSKLECPVMFTESDYSKRTIQELNTLLDEANYLSGHLKVITDSYNQAITLYEDDSVFPGLAFLQVPTNPATANIKDLLSLQEYYKEYYNKYKSKKGKPIKNIDIDFEFVVPPFRKHLFDWAQALNKYNINDFKNDIDILTNDLDNKKLTDEQREEFVQNCVGTFKDNIEAEVEKRRKKGKLSDKDYKEITEKITDLDEAIKELLSGITSLYNTFIDFYGENSPVSCEAILTKEFIEWLEWAYRVTEIIATLLVIVFSIIEFMKAIASSDGDALKKSSNKFIKRIIFLGVLFLLPILINFILKVADISGFDTDNPVCIKVGE